MSSGGATYPSPAGVILVTEDEVLVRMDVVETLISAGYSVLEASSADEAVKLLDGGKSVDLVLTDIRMPGSLDGLGLRSFVLERYPSIPVILASASPPPGERLADTLFVSKPYLPETILQAVESAMERACRDDTGTHRAATAGGNTPG